MNIRVLNKDYSQLIKSIRNEIVLFRDNWDDYGLKTTFIMRYYDIDGKNMLIGTVKIYCDQFDVPFENFNKHTADLICDSHGNIDNLSEHYCSLGQDMSYYKNLKRIFPNEYKSMLKRLRDVTVDRDNRKRLETMINAKISLLRFAAASKVLNEAPYILSDVDIKERDSSFTCNIKVPYDNNQKLKLKFDFKRNDQIPHRINIIIGKNGVGKTQILARLADLLTGFVNDKEVSFLEEGRPSFDKVMSISYSAFDDFKKPSKDNFSDRKIFNYVYCGIQSDKGTLSLNSLKNNLIEAYKIIVDNGRENIWLDIVSEIMEGHLNKIIENLKNNSFENIKLSSGQQLIICTITELVANIEKGSIILFDEPELHLHPNAISNIIRVFYKLLDTFDSYAIFATHSPLILQEMSSKYITIIERIDDMPILRKPEIECFGNNISDIIYDVFDVKCRESNYKTVIKKLLKTKTKEEVKKIFDNQLSLNALIYLENIDSGNDI